MPVWRAAAAGPRVGAVGRVACDGADVAGVAVEGLHGHGDGDGVGALADLGAAGLDLDHSVGGEPDAEDAAVGAAFGEALAFDDQREPRAAAVAALAAGCAVLPGGVVSGGLQSVHRVAGLGDDLADRPRAGGAQVAGAHLRRVQPGERGQAVDLPLEREMHLGCAEAAEGAGDAVIGVDGAPRQVDGVEGVGPRRRSRSPR